MLDDRNFQVSEIVKKSRKRRANPVSNLSNALNQYKTERISTENELINTIKKVNLDKTILFKEKQNTLWKDQQEQDQRVFADALKKEKADRYDLNIKQKHAYQTVLLFMKERGTKPMQEEKQILDGIRIILENGWVVKTEELIKYFDLLGLKDKSQVVEENLRFLEFTYLVGRLFDIDIVKLKHYFDV